MDINVLPDGPDWTLSVTAADSGRVVFDDMLLQTPGIHHIEVSANLLESVLVPISVHMEQPEVTRYFGDSHFHTGTGTGNAGWRRRDGGDHRGNYSQADFAYRYVRDVSGLDWASASEHEKGMNSAIWNASQEVADAFYEPNRFTTLYAYEWNAVNEPHRLVVHQNRGNPLHHGRDSASDTFEELIDVVAKLNQPSLIIPHIHAANPLNPVWRTPANHLQRVGEIYSTQNQKPIWGGDDPTIFELGIDNVWSYHYAWSSGQIIGVIGSSDDHFGLPGRNSTATWVAGTGGLAVVLAEENTRESIFDGLYERHTYATTGTRILLDFSVDGQLMGSVVSTASDRIDLSLQVAGTAPLSHIEIVRGRNSGVATSTFDAQDALALSVDGSDDFDGDATMYYVRVIQENGEMAWSSPIWIEGQF